MNIGMIAPLMDTSHIGRRECQSPDAWYRTDCKGSPAEITLYVLHKDDFTPGLIAAKLGSYCYLCRAQVPHTELLHDELIYTCYRKQQQTYGENIS